MNPYIDYVPINLFDGIFAETIHFESGLNILSGENGTGKTQALRVIKGGDPHSSDGRPLRIIAFSPKRNTERKNVEKIFNELRQQNRALPNYLQQRLGVQLQDNTFDNYWSFAEVYFLVYEEQCKDGGKQVDKMTSVIGEFHTIIKKIFPNYELVSRWDDKRGSPDIKLKKEGHEITIESLSLGEQEILSLVINIYAAKDSNDVFLIDEPEIHLNWHLEEALFNFFDWFCSAFNKQIIVATHSRVVFTEPFLGKTQFLVWQNGHIKCVKSIPDEQRHRIAGESINIVKVGCFEKTTFFVEDESHRRVVEDIAHALGNEVAISKCGNSFNVKSIFRLSMQEEDWGNCFFVIDGDNQENPFPDQSQFIHLDKYCIENYLLDFETASKVAGKSIPEVQSAIFNAVKANREAILKQNKWFEFLFNRLKIEDIAEPSLSKLDASAIFEGYLLELNMEFPDYVHKYIELLNKESKLEAVFPEKLIEAIKPAS